MKKLTRLPSVSRHSIRGSDSDYQSTAVERLRLPFAIPSDPGFLLADALELPTFAAGGETFYSRLTIMANRPTIEKVFFPVDDRQNHAVEIAAWLGSAQKRKPDTQSLNRLERT